MTFTPLADSDLEMVLLIRHFEEALLALVLQGKLHGTTHTCLGQEYIPQALRPLLTEHDFVFSNHRGHGHYLARFNDPVGLLAEIMGREGGICQGVGGSQHIYREQYLSTGVQGESLPVATGVALYLKRADKQGIAFVHIGDGSWGEGGIYEALNIASLWRLPLVVIVENNAIAQSTPIHLQMAGSIEDRARAFALAYQRISSQDINVIREQLRPAIQCVSRTCVPLIVEFETHRLGPHSKGDDSRDERQLAIIRKHDWYQLYQEQYPAQFTSLDRGIRTRVADIVQQVERQPCSAWKAE